MKRPGPLPQAPRPGRPSASADEAPTGPVPVVEPDEAGDVVGGGVSGLRRVTERRPAPADPAPQQRAERRPREVVALGEPRRLGEDSASDDEAARVEGGHAQVGWREVWKAGRARRRALRAEARRFTARTRRRRRYWLGSLGAVVLLVLGTLAAAYSPLFAVRDIRVVGADRVDAEEIADALSGEVGSPMPLVDHSAIRAALLEFPLIETYQVESHPPHELVVRIVERTPVGVIASGAGFTVVDAAGVALSTAGERPKGQPLIEVKGGASSDAFVAAGQVLRSLPQDLHDRVTRVTATSAEDVTLTLGDDEADVVWGSADESAMKALVLSRVMDQRPVDDASVYDVSSPSAVVVK